MTDQPSVARPELDIDPAFLSRLSSMGGGQLVVQLIQMYFTRSVELLEAINSGVVDNDFDAIKNAAHSLISSSGNLGGQQVSYLSKVIEQAALNQQIHEIETYTKELIDFQAAFIEYLKQDLENR